MQFYCTHTFRGKKLKTGKPFDIAWMSLDMSSNSETYAEAPLNTPSRILDPVFQDHVSTEKALQEQRMFPNMVNPNFNGKTTQDFVTMLSNNELTVFSVQGLRNYPQR